MSSLSPEGFSVFIVFIVPINIFATFLLAALVLALSTAYRKWSPPLSKALLVISLGWFLTATYLVGAAVVPQHLQVGIPRTVALPLLSGLSSLLMLHGALILLAKRSVVMRYRIHLILWIITAGLPAIIQNPSANSFATLASTIWAAVALLLFAHILAIEVLAHEHLSRWARLLTLGPIYVYSAVQLSYPLMISEASPRAAFVTLAFTTALVCKLTHMIGLIIYAIEQARHALGSMFETESTRKHAAYVAEMAHEIGTPAAELHLLIEDLYAKYAARQDVRPVAAAIDNVGLRIHAILLGTNHLLRGDLDRDAYYEDSGRPMDVNVLLQAAIISLKTAGRRPMRIRTEFARGPFVSCQPARLMQVFTNVLRNAYDALDDVGAAAGEGRGVAEILTRISREERPPVVVITMRDHCGAVPAEVLPRVFERGDSTRSPERGLGLSIAQTIVKDHGGRITCRSKEDETVFEIRLPYTEDRPLGWRGVRWDRRS